MKQIAAVALVAAAIVFASAGSSQARPHGGHGSSAGNAGHFGGHHSVAGHPGFQGHQGFHGRREVHRGGSGRVFVGVAPFVVGPAYAYGYGPGYVYSSPVYAAPPPAYWYYCPSFDLDSLRHRSADFIAQCVMTTF